MLCYQENTNEELIEILQQDQSNERVFLVLVSRFHYLLHKYANHYRINGYNREDLLQEETLFLYICAQKYPLQIGQYFAPYFARALHNFMVNLLRQSHRHQGPKIALNKDYDLLSQCDMHENLHQSTFGKSYQWYDSPETQFLLQEKFEAYQATLSAKERLVVDYAYHLQLTNKEIADLTGLSPDTVRHSKRRAKDKYKKFMQ